MNSLKNLVLRVAMLACLLALPTAALASTIEFGGSSDNKGVHLHSQGRINFQWVPVTGTTPSSPGDPINNEFWGANDLRVFDAIGQNYVQAGQTYSVTNNYGVSMWFDASNLPDINSQDQTPSGYTTWDFSATLRLTSISFSADGQSIAISGYLSNMLNNLTGSAILSDLASTTAPNFILNIVNNAKTTDMIAALNSGSLSSWANLEATVGMTVSSVPEPGTMGLMASALALSGWWRRRQQKAREAAPAA